MSAALQDLERRLWTDGAAAFAELMSEDGVMVVPHGEGVKGKAAVAEMLAPVPTPDRVVFLAMRTTELADGVVALSYRADAEYDGRTLSVFNSSVWREESGAWRLALHQQTGAPGSEL